MTSEKTDVKYPAEVVRLLDQYTVVMNRGSKHGVEMATHFLVYATESKETIDPSTGLSLGKLEIVRGTVEAIHVQDQMAILKSNRTVSSGRIIRKIRNPSGFGFLMQMEKEIIEEPTNEPLVLRDVQVGDSVRPI